MRALITLIAILTVGIVTAQDYSTYQGDIPYRNGELTIGGEQYTPIGDIAHNLNIIYPATDFPDGTPKALDFLREIYLINNNLLEVNWLIREGTSSNINNVCNEGTGLSVYVMDRGVRTRFIYEFSPPEEEVIAGRRLEAVHADQRRNGTSVTTRFSVTNGQYNRAQGQIDLIYNYPGDDENYDLALRGFNGWRALFQSSWFELNRPKPIANGHDPLNNFPFATILDADDRTRIITGRTGGGVGAEDTERITSTPVTFGLFTSEGNGIPTNNGAVQVEVNYEPNYTISCTE